MKVSIIIEHDESGYYAFAPELPGCHSQGDTFEEARSNVAEAITLYLSTLDGEIIKLEKPHRAIVTILEEASIEEISLLSEQALAEDWLKPEEDEAWAHLQ
jgi:predicted RNase H-like HicB family nuclease